METKPLKFPYLTCYPLYSPLQNRFIREYASGYNQDAKYDDTSSSMHQLSIAQFYSNLPACDKEKYSSMTSNKG